MATSFRTTTPPPPSTTHTPTTPKHGWEDNYQPHSPRKSARVLSQQARAAQTPPHISQGGPHSPTSSRTATSTDALDNTLSPPSSSTMAPSKRLLGSSPVRNVRGASGASAAAALGLPPSNETKMESRRRATTILNNGMLPTPAKTPQKKASEVAAGITSIARNLFPIRGETADVAMPSPRKNNRKKYTGFTLDSFEAEDEDAQIPIYTDTNDRIPEADASAANPFYGQSGTTNPEPVKRASKRRKIAIPGEGEQTLEEAERREDGLVYVFRGKKIFRKFTDEEKEGEDSIDNNTEAEIDAQLEASLPARLRGPLTRASIKPRLLFPTAQQVQAKEMRSQATEDEEEAVTDIEEMNGFSTPADQLEDAVTTPKAPKFAPASPPTTARITRSKKVDVDSSPVGAASDKSLSPFLGWSVAKDKSTSSGKKRGGESLNRGGRGKRVRGE